MTDLELARGIAAKFHTQQMYGVNEYTYHLDAVERSVAAAYPNDERLTIIAHLHDILEDTKCTSTMLHEFFDEDILDAVRAITFRHYDEDETRAEYIARVKQNPLALKVKIHDSACNLNESLLRCDWKRVKKYGAQLAELTTV